MLSIESIKPSEIEESSRLIERVFMQFEAPEYSREGIDNFLSYIQSDEFMKRLRENHFDLIAKFEDKIEGIIEVRSYSHICLLFVAPEFQKRGIGTQLLEKQLDEARHLNVPVRLQVLRENLARQLYERLGFIVTGKTETHYLMEWNDH